MIKLFGVLLFSLLSFQAQASQFDLNQLTGTYISSGCKEYDGLVPTPSARLMMLDAWDGQEFKIALNGDKLTVKATNSNGYFDATFNNLDGDSLTTQSTGPWNTNILTQTTAKTVDSGALMVTDTETTGDGSTYRTHATTRLAGMGKSVLYVFTMHTVSKTPDFTQDYFDTRHCILTKK